MKLRAEKIDFVISTTDLKLIYTEPGSAKLYLDVQTYQDFQENRYRQAEINFQKVAEVRCTSLNFFETYYKQLEIDNEKEGTDFLNFWKESKYHPDPLFYQVEDSQILSSKGKIFDPTDKLNLKHYLLAGYDSYVEIIATGYQRRYTKQ